MNVSIQYPQPQFTIREMDGVQQIFDSYRRKYITLTSEEWVRQNLLNALVQNYNFPKGRIAVEKELIINGMKKRYDAVVYDERRNPWMIIECKAPQITLSADTLLQASNYYKNLQCPYLMLSNGANTFVATISLGSFRWLDQIPAYNM
jgi:type I site-specific restriction endonuclease